MSTASDPPFAKDPAARRAADYLRAHGLPAPAAERLAAGFASVAAQRAGPPGADPAAGPIDAARAAVDAWAAALVEAEPGESLARRSARGRARALLAGVPERWPDRFAAGDPPPEMHDALAAVRLWPTPELAQATMTPGELDLGPVSAVADETWHTFDKWPVLRSLALWTLFLLLLVLVFFTVRF